ncbi:SDR family NAD(P)-dependent oxidoreductase [Desulfogranum japonicum]|uniref:SDR family NAD(P)-dependent oxidoreductase n=1 Tax=Desulfogranum japonicum TaxID=231447 RepID=UPI0003F9E51D|nr:SDR family NAD(P)-dependent oxidoreductase [Desulfogranum japonicum]
MKILITGATSGIGKQLALDYHAEGHEVWALGRNERALAELSDAGLHTGQLDLTDREAVLAWFSRLQVVDLAILNAGTCEYIDLPAFDSALIQRVMRANVETVAICLEAVLPVLRKSSHGHLAVVGSSAAYLPLPRAEAYGASKAAVAYMVESLRMDLHKEHISVSLISPGFVKTPLTDRNDFPMPFRVSVERASAYIRKGLHKRRAEVHFPKRFTYVMKFFSLLPGALWSRIGQWMVRS